MGFLSTNQHELTRMRSKPAFGLGQKAQNWDGPQFKRRTGTLLLTEQEGQGFKALIRDNSRNSLTGLNDLCMTKKE